MCAVLAVFFIQIKVIETETLEISRELSTLISHITQTFVFSPERTSRSHRLIKQSALASVKYFYYRRF